MQKNVMPVPSYFVTIVAQNIVVLVVSCSVATIVLSSTIAISSIRATAKAVKWWFVVLPVEKPAVKSAVDKVDAVKCVTRSLLRRRD